MRDEKWLIEENRKTSRYNWCCHYHLIENESVSFTTKEIQSSESFFIQYQINMISFLSLPIRLEVSHLITKIETYFPGCANIYPSSWGFGLITNNLSELFQWVETFKIVLATLYRDHGYEITI